MPERRRRTDGFIGACVNIWDFIDNRRIDQHAASILVFWITWKITSWAMQFATTEARPGIEVAAIIAAIVAPWAAVQGAAIRFYFDSREQTK